MYNPGTLNDSNMISSKDFEEVFLVRSNEVDLVNKLRSVE